MSRLGVALVCLAFLGCMPPAGSSPAPQGPPSGPTSGPTGGSTTAPPSGDPSSSGGITVPDVMGMHRPEAEAALRAAGVRGNIVIDQDTSRLDMKVATVCSEVPGGGRETSASLNVVLGFCVHDAHDDEPIGGSEDLVTMDGDAAVDLVRHEGFTTKVIRVDATDSCKTGRVCAVSPVNWSRDKKQPVTLTVAK